MYDILKVKNAVVQPIPFAVLQLPGHPVHPNEQHLFQLLDSPDALDIQKLFEGSLIGENSNSGMAATEGWVACLHHVMCCSLVRSKVRKVFGDVALSAERCLLDCLTAEGEGTTHCRNVWTATVTT